MGTITFLVLRTDRLSSYDFSNNSLTILCVSVSNGTKSSGAVVFREKAIASSGNMLLLDVKNMVADAADEFHSFMKTPFRCNIVRVVVRGTLCNPFKLSE